MQCCAVGQVVSDVSKDCTAYIFTVKQFWTATRPMTQHRIPEDLEVHQYSCKNLRSHKYRPAYYHAQACDITVSPHSSAVPVLLLPLTLQVCNR